MFYADAASGRVIAWGDLPSGFVGNAFISGTVQSFGRPFSATVELRKADTGSVMFFETGECFHQIKFGQGERHREGAFDDRTMMPEATFRLPDSYLDRLALQYSGGRPVRLFSKEALPGFTEEPEMVAELKRSTERLGELCSPGITVDVQNVFASAALRTYRLELDEGVYGISLGTQITATEYCLRTSSDSQYVGRVVTPVDGMNLGIGMTVASIRKRATGKFGSAKVSGAKAAYIDWEARKVFGLIYAGEPQREKTDVLRSWIGTFRIDQDLYPAMKRAAADTDPEIMREQNEHFASQAERERNRRMSIVRNGAEYGYQ